jgi:hypothetical protein
MDNARPLQPVWHSVSSVSSVVPFHPFNHASRCSATKASSFRYGYT